MADQYHRPGHIAPAIALQASLGMDDAVIKGDGYEALVTRNGVVVGRVYLGTIEEIEDHAGS